MPTRAAMEHHYPDCERAFVPRMASGASSSGGRSPLPRDASHASLNLIGRPQSKSLQLFGGFLVLANTILGAGVLGIAWAFAQTGGLIGVVLLCVGGAASFLGLHFLGICTLTAISRGAQCDTITLSLLARVAGGGLPWELAVDAANFVACSGALFSAMIVVADQIRVVTQHAQAGFAVLFSLTVLPLAFVPNLSWLRFSAVLSLVMVIYFVILVLLVSTGLDPDCSKSVGQHNGRGEVEWWPADGLSAVRIFQALPVFTFCFCGHMTMPALTVELDSATPQRLDLVIAAALLGAAAIYSPAGGPDGALHLYFAAVHTPDEEHSACMDWIACLGYILCARDLCGFHHIRKLAHATNRAFRGRAEC
eukprot:gnl/TRDRNA2_/TRDRNA2_161455_c0_seq2.p1 gnl/TRDRNA2_/TRDRNA2_161455_c0~~gnl/TRDRNA2_/TRDRNA2_161455_c0_seq2.p1  ORF type:complete len:365 (+),score=41.44 gnl/TRDRNA2_/TRDRNA2_161455_c0_seq2:94-1188(+)